MVPSGHCAYVEEVTPRVVRIYDPSTGTPVATLPEFSTPVEFVSLARNESRVAVRTADGKYSVWSYAPVNQLFESQNDSVAPGNMQLSPTGEKLIVFIQEALCEFDIASSNLTTRKHPGSEESAVGRSLDSCLSHDARQYVYESDVRGNSTILVDLRDHTYRNLSDINLRKGGLRFNHDGSRLISTDDQLRVIDTATGETLLEMPLLLRGGSSLSGYDHMWVSDNDSRMVCGSSFRGYFLLSGWRFSNQHVVRLRGGQTRRDLDDKTALLQLDIAPQGNRYMTLHSDGVARVQDSRNGRIVAEHRTLETVSHDLKMLSDGTEVVSVGTTHQIRRWNVESGETRWLTDAGYETWSHLQVDPSETQLAAYGDDGTLCLMNLDDGRRLWSVKLGEEPVVAIRFTPDNELMAAATLNGKIHFFTRRDGNLYKTLELLAANGDALLDFAFSRGGSELTGIHEHQISRMNWDRGEMLDPFEISDNLTIEVMLSVHYDEKNRVVLHGRSFDRMFAIRFDESGRELHRDLMEVEFFDSTIGLSDYDTSGNQLAIGLRNGDVCLLSVGDRDFVSATIQPRADELPQRAIDVSRSVHPVLGMPRWTIETRTPRGMVESVALTPRGQVVATSASGTVYLLGAEGGQTQGLLIGHAAEAVSVAASETSSRIASAGADGKVQIWDSQTRRLLHTIDPTVPVDEGDVVNIISVQRPPVGAVAISPADDLLAVGGVDGAVTLWNLRSGVFTGVLVKPSGQRAPIQQLAFSRDGDTLAVSGKQLVVDLWDVRKQSHMRQLNVKHWSPALVFSPDGTRLYAADGYELVDWALSSDSRDPLHRVRIGSYGRDIAMNRDGDLLAVCGGDVTLVPALDFDAARKVDGMNGVNCATFSEDGSTLFVGGNSSITAIDVEKGMPLWRQGSNEIQLAAASWSADGSELSFGGTLWQLVRWKVFESNRPVFSPIRGIRTTRLSPDGKQLAVASLRDGKGSL